MCVCVCVKSISVQILRFNFVTNSINSSECTFKTNCIQHGWTFPMLTGSDLPQ